MLVLTGVDRIQAISRFFDWRYLALAAAGGLIAFALSRVLHRLAAVINVLDAIGLSANLSPTRANGLLAMIKQMRLYALAFEAKAEAGEHQKNETA